MTRLWLGVAVVTLAACTARDAGWKDPAPAPPLHAIDVRTGASYRLEDHRDRVLLLSFGYTSCLETCPDTFAAAKRVFSAIGEASRDLQFAYVTVDPERDTPESMRTFLSKVDPRFVGLYVPPEALPPVLAAYDVTVRKRLPVPAGYARRDVDPGAYYTMDHTSGFWGIDRRGRLRFHFGHDASDGEIVDAVQRLLRESS